MINDSVSRHILIVCADRQMSSLYGSYLHADCAHSENEAIRLLRAQRYDVLVVEFMTGGMNGFSLMERIAAQIPTFHGPVIAMSALCNEALMNAMQRLGISYVLKTPCSLRTLRSTIRCLLEENDPTLRQEEKLRQWLLDAGCSFTASGLRYLVSCVSLYLRDHTQPMKTLYACTAQRYEVTSAQVESAIRNFISGDWVYTVFPECTTRHLTNSRVIGMLAERSAQWID